MLTLQGKNDLWFLQKQWAAEITNLQRIIEGNKMAKINIEKRIVVQFFNKYQSFKKYYVQYAYNIIDVVIHNTLRPGLL